MDPVTAARHSVDSSAWYSPPMIVEPGREALGGVIDLDPMSDEAAQQVVRATRYVSLPEDGLAEPWGGRVLINPPNPQRPAWEHLMRSFLDTARGLSAVYVVYSIEALSQSQLWSESTRLPAMLDFPTCIPRRRIPFLRTTVAAVESAEKLLQKATRAGQGAATLEEFEAKMSKLEADLGKARQLLDQYGPLHLVPGAQPSHASAIVGVGIDPHVFYRCFGHLGEVVRAWRTPLKLTINDVTP